MKAQSTLLSFLAATMLASIPLHADVSTEFQKQLDEISQLLKPADSDTPEVKTAKLRMSTLPASLLAMVEQGQLRNFSQFTASSLERGSTSIPGMAEKLAELDRIAQQELLRRDQVELAEGEALIKEAGELLQSAKKPEDLDGVLAKLSHRRPSDYQQNPKLASLRLQIQTASQIVGNWQEYLIAKETGNAEAQVSNLQQVSSALSSTPIIPRSIVLRLLSPSTPSRTITNPNSLEMVAEAAALSVDPITTALTESGDAAAALQQLKQLPPNRLNRTDDSGLLRTVQSIENLRMLEPSMTETEVIANARTLNPQGSQNRLIYNRALDQIVLNSIARNYAIAIPSAKLTTPRKVVEAIAETATTSQNWPRLRKAIGTLENLTYPGSSPDNYTKRANDLRLLSLLEVAKGAEERNDMEAAASAYIEAATLDGSYIRRELAYGKLADLKQKAPDKLEPILVKAEEKRLRAEASRYTAELEARDRTNMHRNLMIGPGSDRIGGFDRATMKLMTQEVVAEFLKEKRLEAATQKPEDAAVKPKDPQPKPEDPTPKKD